MTWKTQSKIHEKTGKITKQQFMAKSILVYQIISLLNPV